MLTCASANNVRNSLLTRDVAGIFRTNKCYCQLMERQDLVLERDNVRKNGRIEVFHSLFLARI